ncbi:MAG TPA: hypothetical protein VMU33_02445 [Burkholderiaceae bacterium]|nr:hypothetical protein [Burkholderiaceae bacterium]
MRFPILARRRRNRVFAALLLVTFCARGFIPIGFMPAIGGAVICRGYAPAPDAVGGGASSGVLSALEGAAAGRSGLDGDPSKEGKSRDHEGATPCPFAVAGSALATGRFALMAAAEAAVADRVQLPPTPVLARGTIAPTGLPRGPPRAA